MMNRIFLIFVMMGLVMPIKAEEESIYSAQLKTADLVKKLATQADAMEQQIIILNEENKILRAMDQTSSNVEWVGHPMISNNDPYTPSEGWLIGIEIGLRKDGVVVWRRKK